MNKMTQTKKGQLTKRTKPILESHPTVYIEEIYMPLIKSTQGKFFTLTTTDGITRCVQFRNETPLYIEVFDRNVSSPQYRVRRIAKDRIYEVSGRAVEEAATK